MGRIISRPVTVPAIRVRTTTYVIVWDGGDATVEVIDGEFFAVMRGARPAFGQAKSQFYFDPATTEYIREVVNTNIYC